MDAGIYDTLTRFLVAAAATLSLGSAGARNECDSLRAPAGSKLAAHFHATGVQIYRWSGRVWTFVAPEAVLYADTGRKEKVGKHFAGPTWESVGGSTVVGGAARRCTPDAAAIPWLSLTAVSGDRPGVFRRVTFIQRTHTVGGLAPSAPGSVVGEEARVPYSAEYLFYRSD